MTDAKGRIAIGGLAPGRWALEVRKPGFMSFRAEIALSGGEKPVIVLASQHNVPGAVSTLRVRLGRARNAPPAPARVERVAAAPPAPTSAAATPAAVLPAAPTAARGATPVPASAPAPAERPPVAPVVAAPAVAAPAAKPTPAVPVAAAAAPTVAVPPLTTPAAVPPRPAAPAPVVPPAPPVSAPVSVPAPAPPAMPAPVVAPTPAAAPPARLFAAAPMARACYECRVGESALLAEAELAAGGAPCPASLAARLAELPLAELPSLASSLPGGCAVLAVPLPAGARYVGFRYEAAGGNGRSEDCLAGRDCPAGACRFAAEPLVRRDGDATVVLALFESSAARRAGFTVYWRRTR